MASKTTTMISSREAGTGTAMTRIPNKRRYVNKRLIDRNKFGSEYFEVVRKFRKPFLTRLEFHCGDTKRTAFCIRAIKKRTDHES